MNHKRIKFINFLKKKSVMSEQLLTSQIMMKVIIVTKYFISARQILCETSDTAYNTSDTFESIDKHCETNISLHNMLRQESE